MKLAVIGSRNFDNYPLLRDSIYLYYSIEDREGENIYPELIISGGAAGADMQAAFFATAHNIPLKEYLPDWDKYGKRAGFIRNQEIIKNCDCVLAFWDGLSKGTASSLSIAKKLKKNTVIIYF